MKLSDVGAERAVLAGVFRYGKDVYYDIAEIIDNNTFTIISNQVIYSCLVQAIKNNPKLDIPVFLSAANDIGVAEQFKNKEELEYLRSLINFPIEIENVSSQAKKIKKLEVARIYQAKLKSAWQDLEKITGTESINEIVSKAEKPIFDFAKQFKNGEDAPVKIGEGIRDYVEYLKNNPNRMVGIPSGFDKYDDAIGGGFRRKTVALIGARSKALRYGSLVYTKTGNVKIETIKVGDKVLHPFLGETKVTAVHDHVNKQLYTVTFRDGDTVECCEDHLWEVYKRYPYDKMSNKIPVVKSTKELINDIHIGNKQEYKWDVRLPTPVVFDAQPVELDPYVLGLLIGDGCFGNSICLAVGNQDSEIIDTVKRILGQQFDIKIDNARKNITSYRINGLQPIIRKLGLFKHKARQKFIPKHYIYNSIDVRLNILRGLLDSDGTIFVDKRSTNSRIKFGSVSLQLMKDVKEIVQSLGGLCSIKEHHQIYKNKPHLSYVSEVRLPKLNPFKLRRKADKYSERIIGELKRTIIKITPSVIDNARCLTLEHNDGLFMTDNYVVTHNTGKSVFADNVAIHVAGRLNIPVLMIDTEMSTEDHQNRLLAYFSKVNIRAIERGHFVNRKFDVEKVDKAAKKIEDLNYTYKNVAGKDFDAILSIIRRWIYQEVGFDENGRTKDCLVIYDYFKLMNANSLESMQEYQALGFQVSDMHNFCVEHDIPVLAFVQLNRDGIDKELTSAISQSDRLVWLCTNVSLYKVKTEEEIAEDGPENGNRKLIPLVARHGPGIEEGNYISMHQQGEFAMITELRTKAALRVEGNGGSSEDGFGFSAWDNGAALDGLPENKQNSRTGDTGDCSSAEFPTTGI